MRPTEEQLAIMRKARLKERKMLFLIQEITVHLIFTIVIALVTYGHKDHRSVYLYRHIDELSKTTDQVCNICILQITISVQNYSFYWSSKDHLLFIQCYYSRNLN